MRIDEFAIPAFSEHFETSPGTDEVYTSTHVDPGNVIDPDFDTTVLGGGTPPGWGAQCGLVSIGAGHGAGGWRQHIASPGESLTGFVTTFSFLLSSSSLTDGQGITIMVHKSQGDPGTAPLAWRVYLWKDVGGLYLLFIVGEDLFYRYPAVGSISTGVVYNHEVKYDLLNDQFSWSVNGTQVVSAALPGSYPQDIATKYLGSSGSSTGSGVYLIDRIVSVEISDTLSAADLVAFPSFGFDVEASPPIVYDTLYFTGWVTRAKSHTVYLTRQKNLDIEG